MFTIVLLLHPSRIDTGKFGVKNLWRIGIIHDILRFFPWNQFHCQNSTFRFGMLTSRNDKRTYSLDLNFFKSQDQTHRIQLAWIFLDFNRYKTIIEWNQKFLKKFLCVSESQIVFVLFSLFSAIRRRNPSIIFKTKN